ncbi:MAG TPA: single-stranded DNA-binding protein [Ignavibacteriaceae bacterium]|nr:single-stranded DNA-binding protein [Ignavibacteriaceae bacterium]HPO63885.1 single-stranded DNA-binding protein [Candidatus Kapabacteria bacterium]
MSRTLNKVMLIGNVGRNPDLKYTPSGIPVTSFRLATSETWKDRDGNVQEHTDWHTIVAWRGLAEVIHRLVKKGSRVYIEGRIQTRSFDDKTGNRRHVVEVLADNMLLLEARKLKDDDSFDDDRSLLADQSDFDLDLNLDYESEIPMGSSSHSNEFPF